MALDVVIFCACEFGDMNSSHASERIDHLSNRRGKRILTDGGRNRAFVSCISHLPTFFTPSNLDWRSGSYRLDGARQKLVLVGVAGRIYVLSKMGPGGRCHQVILDGKWLNRRI